MHTGTHTRHIDIYYRNWLYAIMVNEKSCQPFVSLRSRKAWNVIPVHVKNQQGRWWHKYQSQDRKRLLSSLNRLAESCNSSFFLLFSYSYSQWIGSCPPHLGEPSPLLKWTIQMQIPYKNTLTNTLRNNVFSHIMYQSSWHIKLAIQYKLVFPRKMS